MQVPCLSWNNPLEKKTASHSSILAQKIPWTEEPGRLQSTGHRVRHDLPTEHAIALVRHVCRTPRAAGTTGVAWSVWQMGKTAAVLGEGKQPEGPWEENYRKQYGY